MNKKNLLTLALILGSIVQADAASQQVQEVLATTDTRAIDQSFSQAYKPMSKMQDQAPAVTVDDSLPSANKEVFFKSVHFEGNKNISDEELRHIMAPVLGKKVSFKEVLAAVQGVSVFYREKGYFTSRAMLPAQKVVDQKLTVQIIEADLGDITFTGDLKGLDSRMQSVKKNLLNSSPLNLDILERELLLLRSLPNLEVTTDLKPSQHKEKASDLVIHIKRNAIAGMVNMNNNATDSTGPEQGSASLSFYNPLAPTHGITVGGARSLDPSELYSGNAGYSIPLSENGTMVSITSSLSRTHPQGSSKALNLRTKEERAGISFTHPLVRGRHKNIVTGIALNSSNSLTTILGGQQKTKDRLRTLQLLLNTDFSDSWKGVNVLNFSVTKGTAALGGTPSTFRGKSVAKARTNSYKGNLMISRTQLLTGPLSLFAMVQSQLATSLLLTGEKFRVGGAPYNKAYDGGVLTGDSGYEARFEGRYGGLIADTYSYIAYVYHTRGKVWKRSLGAGEKRTENARAIGLGLKVGINKKTSFDIEFGQPLDSPVGGQSRNPKVSVGLVHQFST